MLISLKTEFEFSWKEQAESRGMTQAAFIKAVD